jgi:hypothetical protein
VRKRICSRSALIEAGRARFIDDGACGVGKRRPSTIVGANIVRQVGGVPQAQAGLWTAASPPRVGARLQHGAARVE